MGAVILSPHLDDAVFSCWHLLAQPGDVSVVNVFAGSPNGAAASRAWWDRLTRASSAAERMEERRAEDATALGMAGRGSISLDFLDEQYRARPQPFADIAVRLAAELDPATRIYAPAGIGDVPDHALVRDAALALRRDAFDVSLYADLPHALLYGWPASVAGAATDPRLDVDAFWELTLRDADLLPEERVREVHTLDENTLADKLAAVRAYASQLPGLIALNPRLADRASLRHEVVWSLAAPASARAAPRPAVRATSAPRAISSVPAGASPRAA